MKLVSTVLLSAYAAAHLAAQSAPVKVLNGFDPVILATTSKEKDGLPSLTATRGRFLYQFATAENKAIFEKDPQRYEVQMNGMCARMGPPTGGGPGNYMVYKGLIYLFGSGDCREAFEEAPEKFIEKPVDLTPGPAADQKRASAMIAKALEAAGGAAKIDGMKSLKITAKLNDGRTDRIAYFRFPEDIVLDDSNPRFRSRQVMTASDAFRYTPGQPRLYPFPPSAVELTKRDLFIQPLLLLRHRGEFQILGTSHGPDGDRADVVFMGARLSLGFDAATGELRSISRQGRNKNFEVAVVTDTFPVAGATVEIDVPVPAELFIRPPAAQ
ncbi:MAG: hypothetical protein ABI823_13890 [Bryobacteraceae bacterium]